MEIKSRQIILVYDKQCPACSFYCNLTKIEETVGQLVLINARSQHPILKEITEAGLDIDQGMVLKIDGILYYGADVMQVLALIGSSSGFWNRINFWIFRSRVRAHLIYPLLKLGRNLLLKILGRSKINNLKLEENEHY